MRRLRPIHGLCKGFGPSPSLLSGVALALPSSLLFSTLTQASTSLGSSGATESPVPDLPKYYNFATREAYMRRHGHAASAGRRLRGRAGGATEEEYLLFSRGQKPNPADPPGSPVIFRRDIQSFGSSQSRNGVELSVDVPSKRFFDLFCDYEKRRCKLCNESFVQWHIHASGIPHGGREGILHELLRPFGGTPEEQLRRWNYRLHHSTAFGRIQSLSDVDNQVRKRKLKYLLHYLKDRGVLTEVFRVSNNTQSSPEAARTFEFERLEFFGDGVVKYVLNNVLSVLFPINEGGTRGKLANFQFVMDGNEGLARNFDFLELQDLIQSTRVVSKFKSDVVETLFGELQFYLWATELDTLTESVTFPYSKDVRAMRALVQHVMYETAITVFMYHVEYVAAMLQRVVREEQLQYVRADPSLMSLQARSGSGRRGTQMGGSDVEDFYMSGGRHGGGGGGSQLATAPAPTTKLMSVRVARAHLQAGGSGAAAFFESTNYDNFKRVVPIGGLLPRPFAPGQLSVIPNYMPHVQRDWGLTERVRRTEATWQAELEDAAGGGETTAAATASQPDKDSTAISDMRLSPTPQPMPSKKAKVLSVPQLKDEELIAELI